MVYPIDLNTASPTEYLRYLQFVFSKQFATLGGWRSRETDAVLYNKPAVESRLQQDAKAMLESFGVVEEELEEVRRTISEIHQSIIDVEVPQGIVANPAFYVVIMDLVQDVERAIARLGYEVSEEVTFGPLPTGQVNGLACAVPAGGLIVALDDGVFTYLNLLAKAVATFYELERAPEGGLVRLVEGNIHRAVTLNREGNRRWLEATTATFVYGHPDLAPPWPAPYDKHVMVDSFLTSAEMFIVAHEYAHLILRHYDREGATYRHRMAGGAEVDNLEISRQEEFEADRLALEILREHHRQTGRKVENTRWSIRFLHGCLTTLEVLNGLGNELDQPSTHPTPGERTARLLQSLDEEEPVAEGKLDFTESVYMVMEQLFLHNLERYFEWRELAFCGAVPWSLTQRPDHLDSDNSE